MGEVVPPACVPPEMKAYFDSIVAASREESRKELEEEKAKHAQELKQVQETVKFKMAQQRSENLPQCAEHTALIGHPILREQWQFTKDLRVGVENVKVFMDALVDTDSEEAAEMIKHLTKLINMLDLRLSSFNAAMNAQTYKKVELFMKYFATFRPKVYNPTGKWASGELKFEDVQLDEAANIDSALMKTERENKGNGGGGGGGYHGGSYRNSGAGGYSGGYSGGGYDNKGSGSRGGASGSGQAGKGSQSNSHRGGGSGGNGGKR